MSGSQHDLILFPSLQGTDHPTSSYSYFAFVNIEKNSRKRDSDEESVSFASITISIAKQNVLPVIAPCLSCSVSRIEFS